MATAQLTTALGPNDPDDGPAGRQLRGLLIAAQTRIEKNKLGYKVPSQSGAGFYTVITDRSEPLCSCPDFEEREQSCKHIFAVQATIQRDELGGGTPTLTTEEKKKAMKSKYQQDWDAYDRSQLNEQRHFDVLLRELCDLVIQPTYGLGRPRLPVSDMVYAVATKVFTGMSRRRAGTAVERAHERGLIDHVPSHSSITRYLGDPNLTPVLRHLVQKSAKPVSLLEDALAVDATGISASVYDRWYDAKWGRTKQRAHFVKLHAAFGVKTQIVADAHVSEGSANDSPFLADLLNGAIENFKVDSVVADKAYLSRSNYDFADSLGIKAYIPFKSNSVKVNRKGRRSKSWERAYDYFRYQRDEFLERYHVRSMAESGFGAIKAKFGGSLKSKTQTAQFNEVLAKVICHNISVLIRVAYELGIESELETWVADAISDRADEKAEAKRKADLDEKRRRRNGRLGDIGELGEAA